MLFRSIWDGTHVAGHKVRCELKRKCVDLKHVRARLRLDIDLRAGEPSDLISARRCPRCPPLTVFLIASVVMTGLLSECVQAVEISLFIEQEVSARDGGRGQGNAAHPSSRAQTMYSATSCVPSALRTIRNTRTRSLPSVRWASASSL